GECECPFTTFSYITMRKSLFDLALPSHFCPWLTLRKVDVDGEEIVKTRDDHVLQPEVYGPRTWQHNLRVFHFKPNWNEVLVFYKETAQGLCIPTMLWLLLLNGACLGVYIYQVSTFAPVLMGPPYSFSFDALGWVQLFQVGDVLFLICILGYGADYAAKKM